MMIVKAWNWSFVVNRFVRQLLISISLHTFLWMTFHITKPWRNTKILREWKFFCSFRWSSRFEHGPVIINDILAYFILPLSTSQIYISSKDVGSPKSTSLFSTFHNGLKNLVSFQPVWCDPHTEIRIILFRGVRISIPNWKTFSHSYFNRNLSNCLSHDIPVKRCPYIWIKRNDWDFHTGSWFWLCVVVVDESKCLDLSR